MSFPLHVRMPPSNLMHSMYLNPPSCCITTLSPFFLIIRDWRRLPLARKLSLFLPRNYNLYPYKLKVNRWKNQYSKVNCPAYLFKSALAIYPNFFKSTIPAMAPLTRLGSKNDSRKVPQTTKTLGKESVFCSDLKPKITPPPANNKCLTKHHKQY